MNKVLSLQSLQAASVDEAGWSTFSTGCNNNSGESNCCRCTSPPKEVEEIG